ncbi:MAG: hypothetical protein I3273_02630 [Candidatus Moeniiplasma glomeromycotorum]|nr:hypothetical protein [Candidatus Moeniiplasma glomeromycotorum]MCE8167648.1 hypothetical protein [Candidatus Moeniiplasma glomeromycotorum]MCE8169001.1 hypothetical protein [Candidatus Moeniiplasma glomeromycotorum]
MQVYIINYQKDNKTYKKVVLKIVNELTQETFWYSGFLRDLDEQRSWGKSGWLESSAIIYPDKNNKK